MKKINTKGFMLAEVLIVTSFVSGILIFMFIQFSNLSTKYEQTYKYNTVEDLYALQTIKNYITSDGNIILYFKTYLQTQDYLDITDCSNFSNEDYCKKLFELESIEQIFIFNNKDNYSDISSIDAAMKEFINKISNSGTEKYRLIAKFSDSTYATIRFGVSDEN